MKNKINYKKYTNIISSYGYGYNNDSKTIENNNNHPYSIQQHQEQK